MKRRVLATLVLCFGFAFAASAAPVVGLMTDFGRMNEAVGLCHGAILSVDSNIQIVDLCHEIASYDATQAALALRGTRVFPKGTVFVCVVDPGVGTERVPVALKTRQGFFYVGPNNGVFTWVIRDQEVEAAVAIAPLRVNPKWKPGTFDGRDLFSPAAAILAVSQDLAKVGDPIPPDQLKSLPIKEAEVSADKGEVRGVYLRTDLPYGNVWTNITEKDLEAAGIRVGDQVAVEVGQRRLVAPFVVAFGDVPEGRPLVYLCSSGTLAFAINMGDFSRKYALKEGDRIRVSKAPSAQ